MRMRMGSTMVGTGTSCHQCYAGCKKTEHMDIRRKPCFARAKRNAACRFLGLAVPGSAGRNMMIWSTAAPENTC
jgi:hypothetical protein